MPVDPGQRNDPADGIAVVNEILAEGLTRPKVDLFRQMSYLGAPE
jgi:hypothetical protein